MIAYSVRRILWIIPVLWVIATLTFFIMQAVPGGPFESEKTRPPALEQAINEKYGLDDPVWEQYVTYMVNVLQLDFGISITRQDEPVSDTIRRAGFISLQIATLSLLLATAIGMTLGTISALQHNKPMDYAGVGFATIGASVPHFVLGAFLSIIFAVHLGWFDLLGWGGPKSVSEIFDPSAYDWRSMVLPVVALSMLPAAYIARVTRASMLEVLNQDYIRTARAKGLREYRVVVRHTIRNALIPVLTVLGPIAAILISGSFIIETMFGIAGIGHESIVAVQRRDYGLIMGTTLFFALIVAFSNLAIDLLYAVVDPRIRYR
jgi:oligopeptide transport system permease protein